MAESMRARINDLFPTGTAAKAFDYLAKERKPKNLADMKFYLEASVEDTHKALEHLENNNLVCVKRSGMISVSDTSLVVSINATGLKFYKMLQDAGSKL
jgi:predicted transcriptional regulator